MEQYNLLEAEGTSRDREYSLVDGDLTSDELQERRDVITSWEEKLEDRRLIKHALALFSDAEAAREQRIDVGDRAIR